ncbi:uncharacterized protein LOC106867249 isoform X1 [Octopus bimaculoides]|uniref:uncharacterized protein LOC106867249 isoform X1 n=1 Tax=Octopus bimaculoides TaxID=37653 RepID=UPI00071D83C6|nr:uncharacterized protein LOC106867249 isoform X1 [Octopus bimaculoides]|eukprot:XP_014767551.1 PREDICTED: uncharacterized protein LOC106867249 [Octopus bimaculoides]
MAFPLLFLFALVLTTTSGVAPPPLDSWSISGINSLKRSPVKPTNFRYRYLTRSGNCLLFKPDEVSIRITATNNVYERAITVTCLTLSKITQYMPREVFANVSKSHGVGIFTLAETLSVYPENADLVDRPECFQTCEGVCNNTCTFDGRKYSEVAGLTNEISLSNMESILCLPTDIYQGAENILTHEFAHLVHMYMNDTWKNKIMAAYQKAKSNKLWRQHSYAMENEYEYFAVAAESFFHDIIRKDAKSTGGMNICKNQRICSDEMKARQFLRRHDPGIFYCLSYAFTDDRPWRISGLKPCMR